MHALDDRTLILAKEQNAGIGQRAKVWLSPYGNFYGSFVFKSILLNKKNIGQISIVSAVALGNYFLKNSFDHFSFKWPNDVYDKAFKKKISGILCEYDGENLIVSIGVNFFTPALENENITSLSELEGANFLKKWNNIALFESLNESINTYKNFGFSSFRKKWLERCGHLGKYLQTSCNKNGIFIGLNENAAPVFSS